MVLNSAHLPDEILSEILSPALKVSDDAFADPSPKSQFATCRTSTSAYLLVCKAWLRVATPLLYHVVVLRSKAQVTALKRALSGNRHLARFIKKLRVEGGYGAAMLKIIKAATNVTDLFVSLQVWSSDVVSGLCSGLPLLNPTRVIICDVTSYRRNKNAQLLLDTIEQCIERLEWRNLSEFEVTYASSYPSEKVPIALTLSRAPSLKTLIIPIWPRYRGIQQPPECIRIIANNPSLQMIQFREPRSGTDSIRYPEPHVLDHPSLRGLFKNPENRAPNVSHPTTPVSSISDQQFFTGSVPEHVWERILHFALTLDIQEPQPKERNPYLGIVRVSKMFSRLAQPPLHETLVFSGSLAFTDFLDRLRSNRSLIPAIRALFFRNPSGVNLKPMFAKELNFRQNLHLLHFIALVPFAMPFNVFKDLCRCCGSSLNRLEGIEITKASGLGSPTALSHLPLLRSLSLASKASIDLNLSSSCSGYLVNLEELALSNCEESVVSVFCNIDLPALRRFAYTTPNDKVVPHSLDLFFQSHGSKIKTLEISAAVHSVVDLFDSCEALVDLTVICGKPLIPDSARYVTAQKHACLERISFKVNGPWGGTDRKWAPFLDALTPKSFPSLQSIRLPTITWPTNEHDIAKSAWVTSAERLLDFGVQLVDGEGVGWRRRLK